MPRRRVVTPPQLEALLALPTAEIDLIRHYTLSPADLAVIARRRRPHNRLGIAVQLCALRFPGRLLRPGEVVPREVLAFVAGQLDLPGDALANYAIRSQTRYDQLDVLYAAYGFRTFTHPDQHALTRWLTTAALGVVNGVALAGLLLEELRRRAIAAPGPSVVERMVAAALSHADRHVERQIDARLTASQREAVEKLLERRPDATFSTLAWARQPPGSPGRRALAQLIEQLRRLRSVALDPQMLRGVHDERRRALVRQGLRLSTQHLKALAPLRRRAIVAAVVLECAARLVDDAVGMFDRLIGALFRRAERRAAETLQIDARAINDKVRLLARLGGALIEARDRGADAFAAIDAVMPWERFTAEVAQASKLFQRNTQDFAALALASQAVLRRIGPLFLDAFVFEGVAGSANLLRGLDAMRTFYAGPRRKPQADLPLGFIRRAWRTAVLGGKSVDIAAYELCLFAELRDRLRAGDVWVVGGRQYRAIEDQLIPAPLFAAMKAAGPLPVSAPHEASVYLQERRILLETRLRDVDARAGQRLLADVRVEGAMLKILSPPAPPPQAAERLAARISALMPRVRITGLLAEVARWTGLSECFTHLRTGLPAQDQRVLLTAALADATNLGLTRMAEACSLASYRRLAWTACWHLVEENYSRALARIVAAQQALPLSAVFGDATTSSSDGQHFPLGGQAEATGAINPHKSAAAAVAFYTWVSGRYAPFHTKAISVSEGEAAHVIDGLLYHGGGVDIAVHHTDGGGVSDHVFGLCHLLGFRFAPRIPNLAERRLHVFGPAATWPTLQPFIAGKIDEALIAAHWDDMLRLAASVKIGTTPASLMLRRLGAYPRQNGLALALREVGRIERTLFTLDWLDDPALRRQATAELNKGEARNALARAVCFHRLGRLHDRTLESQRHRASALNLVVAAIILWNTVYIERAVRRLRAGGEHIPDELLSRLSPLGWRHVNLTGDYIWSDCAPLDQDGFRALVDPGAQTDPDVLDLSA